MLGSKTRLASRDFSLQYLDFLLKEKHYINQSETSSPIIAWRWEIAPRRLGAKEKN